MPLVIPETLVGSTRWDYSRSYLFGVVNVTPDSFSDGGMYYDATAAIAQGLQLVGAGADALDIGGESTRPRSEPVSAAEECKRVLPVIEGLAPQVKVPISIDTYKASVARAAVAAGASIINDVSGLRLDPEMPAAVAETGALVIIGHLRGEPASMQDDIAFTDVVAEVCDDLRASIRLAIRAGVRADRIWLDPGIGFGKTTDQSLALVRATGFIREALGYPVMIGPSRKSFIGAITGRPAGERLMGTAAASAAAIALGADALRLHDIEELAEGMRIADAIARGWREP